MTRSEHWPRHPLLALEDWWAVWLGSPCSRAWSCRLSPLFPELGDGRSPFWRPSATVVASALSRWVSDSQHASGGRPIQLYLVGQTFNVVLTLVAAYVAFGGLLFDRIAASPIPADARSVIQRNLDTDVEATALFYTEVPGWGAWVEPTPSSGN